MLPLPSYQLATTAQRLLLENGGFTLDEFGNSITGDLWAVSVEGKEQRFEYLPSIRQIEVYLQLYGPHFGDAAYFGGWGDSDGVYYLDHTLAFRHKHTAIQEAQRNHQKAIFHLGTKELLEIEEDDWLITRKAEGWETEPEPQPKWTPEQVEETARKEWVQELCDKHGPYVILVDVGMYLENIQRS